MAAPDGADHEAKNPKGFHVFTSMVRSANVIDLEMTTVANQPVDIGDIDLTVE